jgi:hypothetical protein
VRRKDSLYTANAQDDADLPSVCTHVYMDAFVHATYIFDACTCEHEDRTGELCMCVCMYVCMHACMYVCMCISIYVYMYVCVIYSANAEDNTLHSNTHTHTHTRACIYMCRTGGGSGIKASAASIT